MTMSDNLEFDREHDDRPLTHEIASEIGLRDIGSTFHGDVWCPSFYLNINCHSGWYFLPVGATVGQLWTLLRALGITETKGRRG